MSQIRHASVFFSLFAALVCGCPSAGENPDPGQDAGGPVLDAGTDMTENSEVEGAAGATRPAAGSGGREASGGASAGAPSAGAGKAGSAGGAAGQSAPDDDAGVMSQPVTKDCVVGGCSNQLCTDAASGPIISTCEWREEYGCYRAATCAKQSNGQCGWTQTPELMQCLQEAGRP